MSVDHPGRWFVHQAKIAVTEIPENAGWLMRKALTKQPVEHAIEEARGGARRVSESKADAVPVGADSLDLRFQRAQEALEGAERAEERALQKMGEANDLAERAEAEMDAAREQLAQARTLADEAAEAARSAADEAHRRAQAMTEQAEAQSRAADERAAEADKARGSVSLQAAESVRQTETAPAADDLADMTMPELLDLAASLQVEGRSGMTKDELANAVRRASGNRRAAASRRG